MEFPAQVKSVHRKIIIPILLQLKEFLASYNKNFSDPDASVSVEREMRYGMLQAFATLTAQAQTQIELRTQAKSVDFSGASSTKPPKTGTALRYR